MKKKHFIFLLLILLCASIPRFYNLHRQGFISWDEGMYMNEALFYQSIVHNMPLVVSGLLNGGLETSVLIEKINGWPPSSAKPLHSLMIYIFSICAGLSVYSAQILSALFGLGLIVSMFFLTRLYFSDEVAVLTALFIAISGYHIYISRLAVPETDSIFFYVLALFIIERYRSSRRYLPYVCAGLAAGICFGLNYRWIIVMPVLFLNVAVHISTAQKKISSFAIKRLISFACAFLSILVVCDLPYWPLGFIDGFSISFRHTDANVYTYLDQLRYYLFFQSSKGEWHFHALYIRFFNDFNGILMTSLAGIGCVMLFRKISIRSIVCILSALIPFVFLSIKSRGNSIRYISIALPFISLYSAIALSAILNRVFRSAGRSVQWKKAAVVLIVCAVSFPRAIPFLTMNSGYAEAYEYLREHNGARNLSTSNAYFEFYFGRNVAEQTPRSFTDFREVLSSGDYRYVVLDFMSHRVLPKEVKALIEKNCTPVALIPNPIGTDMITLMESLGYRHFIPRYLENAYADPLSRFVVIYDAADIVPFFETS